LNTTRKGTSFTCAVILPRECSAPLEAVPFPVVSTNTEDICAFYSRVGLANDSMFQ